MARPIVVNVYSSLLNLLLIKEEVKMSHGQKMWTNLSLLNSCLKKVERLLFLSSDCFLKKKKNENNSTFLLSPSFPILI